MAANAAEEATAAVEMSVKRVGAIDDLQCLDNDLDASTSPTQLHERCVSTSCSPVEVHLQPHIQENPATLTIFACYCSSVRCFFWQSLSREQALWQEHDAGGLVEFQVSKSVGPVCAWLCLPGLCHNSPCKDTESQPQQGQGGYPARCCFEHCGSHVAASNHSCIRMLLIITASWLPAGPHHLHRRPGPPRRTSAPNSSSRETAHP